MRLRIQVEAKILQIPVASTSGKRCDWVSKFGFSLADSTLLGTNSDIHRDHLALSENVSQQAIHGYPQKIGGISVSHGTSKNHCGFSSRFRRLPGVFRCLLGVPGVPGHCSARASKSWRYSWWACAQPKIDCRRKSLVISRNFPFKINGNPWKSMAFPWEYDRRTKCGEMVRILKLGKHICLFIIVYKRAVFQQVSSQINIIRLCGDGMREISGFSLARRCLWCKTMLYNAVHLGFDTCLKPTKPKQIWCSKTSFKMWLHCKHRTQIAWHIYDTFISETMKVNSTAVRTKGQGPHQNIISI